MFLKANICAEKSEVSARRANVVLILDFSKTFQVKCSHSASIHGRIRGRAHSPVNETLEKRNIQNPWHGTLSTLGKGHPPSSFYNGSGMSVRVRILHAAYDKPSVYASSCVSWKGESAKGAQGCTNMRIWSRGGRYFVYFICISINNYSRNRV